MLEVITYGVCAALVGVVYAHILPDEPTPLSPWFNFLSWVEMRAPWLAYPLGKCAMCCAGHIALWSSLTIEGFGWENVPAAIVAASIAILSAPAVIKYYEWSKLKQ